jgi:hypothetical protein
MSASVQVPRRVLITRPAVGSGVGSNIASLIGALNVARAAGADLAVDWTALDEIKDKSINAFARFFAMPSTLMGVRILAPAAGEFPDRVFVPVDAPGLRALAAGRGPAVAEISRYHGMDRIRTLAPDLCPSPAEEVAFERAVYRAIDPTPAIAAKIDEWLAAHIGDRFAVGLNVRMGNGLFDKGAHYRLRVNTRVFADPDRFRAGVARGVAALTRALPEDARRNAVVFFAADARRMHDWLVGRPGFVTRRTVFPPPGVGHVFADYALPGYDDLAAFEDIVFDMYALARCGALIYNGTGFNRLARYRADFFLGNMADIETFFPLLRLIHRVECALHNLPAKLDLRTRPLWRP